MDFSALLDSVDYGAVVGALLAVAGLKVAPIAARWGILRVMYMIGWR